METISWGMLPTINCLLIQNTTLDIVTWNDVPPQLLAKIPFNTMVMGIFNRAKISKHLPGTKDKRNTQNYCAFWTHQDRQTDIEYLFAEVHRSIKQA